MADEETSSIEIKIISGEDLRAFNFFQKLSIFVVASIASDDPSKKVEKSQQQRTPTDRENDGFPEWNHEMRFLLDSESDSDLDHLFIHLYLRHEGVLFGIGDKTIGEVRIPMKDLTDEASSNGVVRFVRYQVRSSDGKPNGVVKLSYKFNSKSEKTLDSYKIRYPTVEEVPNLDLARGSYNYCSSIPIPQLQGSDFWPVSPLQTTPLPQAHLPYANPGYGNRHYYHGAMWNRGSVLGDWNGW